MARGAVVMLASLLAVGCRPRQVVVIGHGADSFDAGMVAPTQNPQVAQYTIRPHSAATVTVEFGRTAAYGKRTWTVPAQANQTVKILVAGMRGDTRYHMRAEVQFADGTTVDDRDHVFGTGHYSAGMIPPIKVKTEGQPQTGVELLNPTIGHYYQAIVTDLQGHVLWAYNYSGRQSSQVVQIHRDERAAYLTLAGWWHGVTHLVGGKEKGRLWDASLWKTLPPEDRFSTIINPIKPMPNGDFVMLIGLASHALRFNPGGTPPPGTTVLLQEVDLTGRTVRQLTMPELNRRLRAHGYKGPTLEMVHHDVTQLPNGNLIVIANGTKVFENLPGYPGKTRVIGDVLVDLNKNFEPVWTWNEFAHLSVLRHPKDFPDWTHTNAVLYTKDDGNLLVSMRTQDWVIKIDFDNGHGSGKVLWRLGPGGDFRLVGGTAPEDWNYGQHEPAVFGDRDAGVFELGMMDNGYGRILADGKECGTKGAGPCYTTAPIFRVDAKARTATVVFRKVFPPKLYSSWGGGVQPLANGDIGIDLCNVGRDSDIYEMTMGKNPRTVWQMHVANTNVYRAERMGSMYPGVTW